MPFLRSKGESISSTSPIACRAKSAHLAAMVSKSPLDDPENAAHAWARYRRIMRNLSFFTLAIVLLVLGFLYESGSEVSIHFYVAIALGIIFTMLLTGALMGLVFLSNGTGHDASVDNNLPRSDEE